MIHSQIVRSAWMGGLVICVIQKELVNTIPMNTEKFARWTLTLAYLKNKELVSIWQIKYDLRQNKVIDAFFM
jgi:hypothetical protein